MITNIEEVKNLVNSNKYLKLFRVNHNGLRLYINPQPFTYYSGLTGALERCTFAGNDEKRRLEGWRASMIDSFGKKQTDDYVQMTADFGTLLHMALVIIKEKGAIKWNEIKEAAEAYFIGAFKEKEILLNQITLRKMVYEYQKHVASLMQFIYERVSEIYAIEAPAIHEGLRIATPLDIVCECRQTDKGEFFDTTINVKTSSQISKHQLQQIAMENLMWNSTYEQKCDFTAIIRTKDWNESKIPTYEYKYLKPEEITQILNSVLKRLEFCLNDEDSTYYPSVISKSFSGETKLGEKPIVIEQSLQEEWENLNFE